METLLLILVLLMLVVAGILWWTTYTEVRELEAAKKLPPTKK